jgi:ATP-dependent DNA helicase RecG
MDWKFDEIQSLREDYDFEAKLSLGRDGRGCLPRDFWPTYSVMVNINGGFVCLGVEQQSNGELLAVGIPEPEPVLKSLWDTVNNPQKVSSNVLAEEDVDVHEVEGRKIIRIKIPEASRRQKPIFINGNPMNGTYRRNYEGDYRCSEEAVKRMLAEQCEDARDMHLLKEFNFTDFNLESIKAYRNQFQNRQPGHPWNACDMKDFMRNIGAWGIERRTGSTAPTFAGILMFGQLRAILDAAPNYVVDYQERPQSKTEARWIDRITTDGSWSGNLYDFYRKVIRKLFADLQVPFRIKDDERVEETPVHTALREALVNTIIHADYSARVSVLVVKRPDMFGFRNPGDLRVPLDEAKRGGTSDCRNRNLQKMFQLIGAGEQAGSGIPRIYTNWHKQHWRQPELSENISDDREETLLRLRMVSLLPDEAVEDLKDRFGKKFVELPETHRIAMVTAAVEGSITHSRLSEMSNEHPHDISKILHELASSDLLDSDGSGRGMYYFLPGCHPVEDSLSQFNSKLQNHQGATQVAHKDAEVAHKDAEVAHRDKLERIAEQVASRKRADKTDVTATIIELCQVCELSSQELAHLLNRSEVSLRTHYLNSLCEKGLLYRKYPVKNHPKQKYWFPSFSEDENGTET